MKYTIIALILSTTIFMIGCGSDTPKNEQGEYVIDATSEETFKSSYDQISKGMTVEERQQVDELFKDAMAGHIMSAAFTGSASPEAYYLKFDGMSKNQLLAEAKRVNQSRDKDFGQMVKDAEEQALKELYEKEEWNTLNAGFVEIVKYEYREGVKFKITNITDKTIQSFKAGIWLHDQYGDEMNSSGLGFSRDVPLKPGESFFEDGEWFLNERSMQLLKDQPQNVKVKIRVSKMIVDGKVIDFDK